MCTDAKDDIKWKLALCTVTTTANAWSPVQEAIRYKHSHAASLILNVLAISWNTLAADAIYMPDLVELLNSFPTLAVPFLTDQIKLVQIGKPFYLEFIELRAKMCNSQWVRAAVSLDPIEDSRVWQRVPKGYIHYMAGTYVTDFIQPIIESLRYLEAIYHRNPRLWNFLILLTSPLMPYWLVMQALTLAAKLSRSHTSIIVQHAIPVRNCNTIELLEAAVNIAERQGSALLFKSEVIAAVTDLHWDLYGRADHVFSLIVYVQLLALFTLLIVMFDTWVATSYGLMIMAWTLQGWKCALTGYFMWQEYLELKHETFKVWVWDAWNIMDATAYSLIYAGVAVQAGSNHNHPAHSKAANVINAISAVLLWFKLLHYMRPYKATGVLVSMIFKILLKLIPFMSVLAITVLGFATAFYSVLNTDKASSNYSSALKYNTVGDALRTSFSYMLGSYELAVLDAGPSDVMLSILWAVFSIIVSILLLNLLIAIISHNFERLYETSEHSYMMEKTKVVLLSHIKLSNRRQKKLRKLFEDIPYIVTFTPYVYAEDIKETTDKWDNRIDTITKLMNGTINSVQADVNSVKTDVESICTDVNSVSTAVTALQQEVSDLKTIIQEILRIVKTTAQ
jgi:Ion transport protein